MKAWILALTISATLILTACRHREFDFETDTSSTLEVVFDWEHDPTAQPKSMVLYLFPAEGGLPYRYDLPGRDGGAISVARGIYHAVCINNDEPSVKYLGEESHSTFLVTTPETSSLHFGSGFELALSKIPTADGCEDQPFGGSAPLLWSASLTDVEVTVGTKTGRASQYIEMKPTRIVDTYQVTVKNIKNATSLTAMSATLSDMADGYYAGLRQHNDAAVTIPVELPHNAATAIAEGQFYTFGHCSSTRRTHKLMIYAIMANGAKYYYEYDVTDQAHSEPDANNVYHIIIDNLDLPEPIGGGGGINPEVDEWSDININIGM